MNEIQNTFEALRRMMALKRHEVPPPGYFEHFSGEVVARIRAGDTGGPDSLTVRLPWLLRLLQAFEAKPAFAGVFASALCVLLVAGIVYAERPDVAMVQLPIPPAQNAMALNIAPASVPAFRAPAAFTGGFISSTNPVFNPQPMATPQAVELFGSQNAFAQPVNFVLPGN